MIFWRLVPQKRSPLFCCSRGGPFTCFFATYTKVIYNDNYDGTKDENKYNIEKIMNYCKWKENVNKR